MTLTTTVEIAPAEVRIMPSDKILLVGSCFADSIGKMLVDNRFNVCVNPYGVMYNPASVLHTIVKKKDYIADKVVITLGTNHVYILNETGEIVDNCQKRPQRLFTEKILDETMCYEYMLEAVRLLVERNPEVEVIVTVSPIRYAKYGYHGSRLSKATLLLAADRLEHDFDNVTYFPAYEIMNDELRDYRFYTPDMLHPSEQAVEYIFQRFTDTFFSREALCFMEEWRPIREALCHRPFNADSEEYKAFLGKTRSREKAFMEKWSVSW